MSSSPARLPRVRASELRGRGWLNTAGEVALADLRGKIVLLDFWTFCCINCLHVLDELRPIEDRYRDVLVVVGVHSPKFVHEADPVALAAAVQRYEVHHPVLDDPELVTWQAYTARAWPTLVVIDPEGYVVAQMAGEGHGHNLEVLLAELVAEHEAKGTLHRGDGPYLPPPPASTTLRFPAKAIALDTGNLLVADAGHHSLAELAPDGETLIRRIGSGERGLVDGGPDEARFAEPNGLCLVPPELRAYLEYDVVVADTANHVLRGVRLDDGAVITVAGTGRQYMVGGPDNELAWPEQPEPAAGPEPAGPGLSAIAVITGEVADASIPPSGSAFSPGLVLRWGTDATDAQTAPVHPPTPPGIAFRSAAQTVAMSSPWDVAWSSRVGGFVVAMAGSHSLWEFDGEQGHLRHLGGTMNEGLLDGDLRQAWFAQPSGLAVDAAGRIWLADAETSALRVVDLVPGTSTGTVSTAVGEGLFDFGHRDGPADAARLQHPLGLATLPDGSVVVADTYNGALRRYLPPPAGSPAGTPGEVTTLATGLAEPSDVLVEVAGREITLLVVESAAHRLTRLKLPDGLAGQVLDAGVFRTARPVTDLAAGAVRLEVAFVPAAGQKLDDRYGPATRLQVSATPPGLLVSGAGDGTDLVRDLVLDPSVGEGVLHVTAQASSCDDDPAVEYPACHLSQQDWGVPVRVRRGASDVLSLPLHA